MENDKLEISPVLANSTEPSLLEREGQLLLGGLQRLPQGVVNRASHAWENKGETAAEIGIAFAAGTALALCAKNPQALWGFCGGLTRAAKPVLAMGLGLDVVNRIGSPMLAVGQDGSKLEEQKEALGKNLGSMMVDYTLMGAAGYAGGRFGGALNRGIHEIQWRYAEQPLAAECEQAARLITNDLKWTQNRLPEPLNTGQRADFKQTVAAHIQDSFGVDASRARWMAEHNYGIPIPEKLTPAQLTKFEAALVDELQMAAKYGRDFYMGKTTDGYAAQVGSRPRVHLGDKLSQWAAERAEINQKALQHLTTWRSALGNGVPSIELNPGSVTMPDLFGTITLYPRPYGSLGSTAAGALANPLKESLRNMAK